MKRKKELKESIENNSGMSFRKFKSIIKESAKIGVLDTGSLAEYYCSVLFDLELVDNQREYIDSEEEKKPFYPDLMKSDSEVYFEVKQRKDLSGMDYRESYEEIKAFFYVILDEETWLPKKIYKIPQKKVLDTKHTTKKGKIRINFNKAKEKEVVFEQ